MSHTGEYEHSTAAPSVNEHGAASSDMEKQPDKIVPTSSSEGSGENGISQDSDQHKNAQERMEYDYRLRKETAGVEKYSKLGWVQLVIVLIVEAIALGSLSIPSAFATLGMIAGVLISVGTGFIAIYTSYVVGQVKIKFPAVLHYSDVGILLGGQRFGVALNYIISAMFVLQLVLLVGSHALTGAIAFGTITVWPVCSIVFTVVSAILLYIFAIPPSFSEMAILGYIDFVSIVAAILLTLIATGIQASHQPGGLSSANWSAYPAPDTDFASAMVAVTNICFAYSFAICQFSFMEEMHTPNDYKKSIWALGLIEIVIYTCTGAIGYAFIGPAVQSPALLSAGTTVSRIAFGIALPVIFISGSINTVTVCRFMMDRMFKNSVIKYVNTAKGWATWLTLILIVTIIAWIVAEAIPFFSDLLGIMSSLFISGFSFYIPGIMWLVLIRQGGFFSGWKNTVLTLLNIFCIVFGIVVLVGGFYGSVVGIKDEYSTGKVRNPFTCSPL